MSEFDSESKLQHQNSSGMLALSQIKGLQRIEDNDRFEALEQSESPYEIKESRRDSCLDDKNPREGTIINKASMALK